MKIISSELYVKDNKVYHEGNKPKPKDIGAAPETHTHNYASATTPGGSAEHAIKATEDSLGQRIDKYIKGLSVSGRTITYTRGDGTTGTITTQDNNTDTKVTNTLNTTAKAYITGTTDSATNTGTQVFDTNVYLDTTAGMLTATTFKGALQGNATTATSATSASQAAKLTTPRSINGTNFDGTAAITTANWGTARTLTIGNTGKSVNGSGNVSWSIGEIGAAPASHNHTSLTGITNLSFAAEGSDSASITTTVDGANTYFDFNLSDDPSQNDMWRWRFRPSGANVFNAMTLDAISTTEAKLAVTGEVQATRLKGTLTGDVKGNVTGTVSGNAGSATKLATARTINGTSFDGTGNITTANWGTARNIQIGNAVKSVNGGANVSWSLSEIGAAPSSHGHSNMLTFKSNHASDWTSSSAMSGKTYMGGWHGNLTSGTTGYVSLGASGGNTLDLMIDGDIYVRENSKVYHSGNKPTPSDIGAAASNHTHNYAASSSAGGNANAAVKLATARSINGTNFDGSANITTANWGTARSIQIGNTSKSVNGSANVSWSLSEIGAAASNHTHTSLNGINLDGVKASLNDYNLSSGNSKFVCYFCPSNGGGANITGRPNDNSKEAFNLIVESLRYIDSTDYITKQTYTQGSQKIMYVRYCTNGTWTAWEKVYTSAQKPTASEIGAAASNHTHNYLPLSGGTVTGSFAVSGGESRFSNGTFTDPWHGTGCAIKASGHVAVGGQIKATSTITAPTFAGALSGNATTATTLQTARTINGTSFNGSVNITTANWGTARNITIGNTTKSVNGSGNVSWNLSEIGAAASSHTHNYAGSSSAGGAANTAVKLATARTIALGGILSGSASFDGSGNVTINATANDITTITKSLNVTTSWADTGITGSNLGTGTYAVQMYVNDGANTAQYQEYYSGMMSWFNGTTNSTDADEILLHKAGHASNGRHVYLRTIRTPNSGYLKLQISCTHAFSAASSITFKFKKLI